MIYLIDRGFRIKNALNILVNQCKYPGIYNECFCLSCNVNQGTCFADENDIVNDLRSSFANNVIDNVNDNDLRSSFANNDNDKDNDNVNVNVIDKNIDNDNVKDNNNDNDNDNDNVNDKDNYIYLFDEKHDDASVPRMDEVPSKG